MAPILLIFLRINCYASVLFSVKAKKHLIEGITSLGLISNSRFMARLSYWMGGHGRIGPLDPPVRSSPNRCCLLEGGEGSVAADLNTCAPHPDDQYGRRSSDRVERRMLVVSDAFIAAITSRQRFASDVLAFLVISSAAHHVISPSVLPVVQKSRSKSCRHFCSTY